MGVNRGLFDELGWALQNCGKIQKLFKSDSSVRLRKCALQLLRIVFLRCREEKKETETLNLAKLFEDTFFDPDEGEKIVLTAFNNLEPIVELDPSFLKRLHEGCKLGDEVIRNRCHKYLKDILPTM